MLSRTKMPSQFFGPCEQHAQLVAFANLHFVTEDAHWSELVGVGQYVFAVRVILEPRLLAIYLPEFRVAFTVVRKKVFKHALVALIREQDRTNNYVCGVWCVCVCFALVQIDW